MDLASENINISIIDNGKVVSISFNDVLKYHTGNAWFGLSIAFRALELAENTFKKADFDLEPRSINHCICTSWSWC
jgi:hypothetical protein